MTDTQINVIVSCVEQVAPSIREYTFTPTNQVFTPFSPGAHTVVEMIGKHKTYRNAYSLLSDPLDTSKYRIAVRLQDNSRGGSVFMHENITVGDEIRISSPANLFAPEWNAKKHLLLAGGIGITPFMSYLPEMQRRNCEVELHYMFHGLQTGAYKDSLKKQLGEQFFSYDSDLKQRCDLKNLIMKQPVGTHIYICGPISLIEAINTLAQEMSIPTSMIHYEEFSAPKPGKPFVVEIKSSGKTVSVESDDSLLEALERAEVQVPYMCRGGVCGQCACTVVEGDIDHRDEFLSADEKAQGTVIMPCVSRAQTDRLVLDI